MRALPCPAPIRTLTLTALFLCAQLASANAAFANANTESATAANEHAEITNAANDPWFKNGHAEIAATRAALRARGITPARAKNIILFLGDGMGVSTITAARILEGQLRGLRGEEHLLSFERFPQTGLVKVYNTNQQVPDSAGTMTALMSGVKTQAGVVGVSARVVFDDAASVAASRVATLFERAERRGLRTGVVSTTELTHATPAACYAHAPSRAWTHDAALPDAARAAGFPDIARQLVEFPYGDGVDVMLGGGRAHFLGAEQRDPEARDAHGARADGRDLAAHWKRQARGRAVVWDARGLRRQHPRRTRQLLGLFAPGHMAFELDREHTRAGEPSLSQMTEAALRFLAHGDAGFVLVVEGGRIDHAHHFNNAQRALHDTIALAAAVTRAHELTDSAETLIVVTADHSHAFSLVGYPTRGNPIFGWVREWNSEGPGGAPTAAEAAGEEPPRSLDGLGRPYTTLQYGSGPGHHAPSDAQGAGPKAFPHFPEYWDDVHAMAAEADERDKAVAALQEASGLRAAEGAQASDPQAHDFLQRAALPFRAGLHSGEDVAVYATGPGAEWFGGVREQHALYHALVAALGWTTPRAAHPTK